MGRAAAEGCGISGLQFCHSKQLMDSTSKPAPGLEAKLALAPGKSLCNGSRCLLGSLESALVHPVHPIPPESAWAPDPSTSLLMACHQPFGVCYTEFGSMEQPRKYCICPGANKALRCQGSVCSWGQEQWHRHDCIIWAAWGQVPLHYFKEELICQYCTPHWCCCSAMSAVKLTLYQHSAVPPSRSAVTVDDGNAPAGPDMALSNLLQLWHWSCWEQGQARELHIFLLF